jgi:hypothetical protein
VVVAGEGNSQDLSDEEGSGDDGSEGLHFEI